MSGAVLLTSPTRVEAAGLLWSLRAAGIDARTTPNERWDGGPSAPEPEDVAAVLALDLGSVDLEREVERCHTLLGRPVPTVVVADRRLRSRDRQRTDTSQILDVGVDTAVVLLLVRRLLDQPHDGGEGRVEVEVATGGVGGLTAREEQVADLASRGLRNHEIAERLDISAHTVRTHVGRVLAKLEVQHRVALHARLRQLRGGAATSDSGSGRAVSP